MKYKLSIGILIVLVCGIMLMSNGLASAGPPIWLNQATLSIIDSNPSQDPENSGFGPIQVVVWEEDNGNDWDIHMKYSLLDGALGSWMFPPLHPATGTSDTINPAVTVTNFNPGSALMEIHVVYEWYDSTTAQWNINHTWTNNFGAAWTAPLTLSVNDAHDPAIVYTEDQLNPVGGGMIGQLVQIVWSELNPASGFYEIQYDAYYYDPTLVPVRGYLSGAPPAAPTLIRGSAVGDCFFPEIASCDERLRGAAFDYYFAIVWQEQIVTGQWRIGYVAGTTTISPGAMGLAFAFLPGFVSPPGVTADAFRPDIAATQDYQPIEQYYFQIDWMFQFWAPAGQYTIESCYAWSPIPTPGIPLFFANPTFVVQFSNVVILDNPTVATKLINLNPTIFETWFAWEEDTTGPNPDIFYAMGIANGPGPFVPVFGPARVPYVPVVGSDDYNPELWNRNDPTRMFPPFTHLVFDKQIAGTVPEIEYIDP